MMYSKLTSSKASSLILQSILCMLTWCSQLFSLSWPQLAPWLLHRPFSTNAMLWSTARVISKAAALDQFAIARKLKFSPWIHPKVEKHWSSLLKERLLYFRDVLGCTITDLDCLQISMYSKWNSRERTLRWTPWKMPVLWLCVRFRELEFRSDGLHRLRRSWRAYDRWGS